MYKRNRPERSFAAVFEQKFHYAIRGAVPGVIFMLPFPMVMSLNQDVGLWAYAACLWLGLVGGFFGGAILDKLERCRLDPDGNEYLLLYYAIIPVLAGALGAVSAGALLALPFMGDPEGVTVVGLMGSLPGLIGALWLESLREEPEARLVARGGILPRNYWIGGWAIFALIEAYGLWEFVKDV